MPRLDSQTDDEYAAYKLRASFFNATARTADGFVGLIFRREPKMKLPDGQQASNEEKESTPHPFPLPDRGGEGDCMGKCEPICSSASFQVEHSATAAVEQSMVVKDWRSRARHFWRNEIRPLLVLGLVLCAIRSSFADWNDVPTGSMKPTILEGDRVFVNKLAYDLKVPFTTWHLAEWANPQRGDIVVFYSPHDGTRLVKRVIGLPGDLLELRGDQLFLNGQPAEYSPLDAAVSCQLPEAERRAGSFATEELPSRAHAMMVIPSVPARRDFGPVRVPEGHYFMMGDNRDNSFDSRFWGSVPRQKIVGRVSVVVLSLDRNHYWLPRFDRFFKALDRSA